MKSVLRVAVCFLRTAGFLGRQDRGVKYRKFTPYLVWTCYCWSQHAGKTNLSPADFGGIVFLVALARKCFLLSWTSDVALLVKFCLAFMCPARNWGIAWRMKLFLKVHNPAYRFLPREALSIPCSYSRPGRLSLTHVSSEHLMSDIVMKAETKTSTPILHKKSWDFRSGAGWGHSWTPQPTKACSNMIDRHTAGYWGEGTSKTRQLAWKKQSTLMGL